MELFNKFTEKIIVFFIKFFEKWLPQTSLFIIIISFLIFIINQFLSIENQLFYFQIVEQVLQRNLLNQNKSSLLINISVVLIGFHITVMSVLGTSYSKERRVANSRPSRPCTPPSSLTTAPPPPPR